MTALDEAIVDLSSIASTCLFLLECPVMSPTIACSVLGELTKSLDLWKAKRKEDPTLDDEDLLTHMFHSAFYVWLCGKCWLRSPPSFASCCGGLIKLGRGRVIESSFGFVIRSLNEKGPALSKALCTVPNGDCDEFRSFISAVITRHEGQSPAITAVKLTFIMTLLSKCTPSFIPNVEVVGFSASVIELVAAEASSAVIYALQSRAVDTSGFYVTDVEVLLTALRLHISREADEARKESLLCALRVVLRDAIPSGDSSRTSDLLRWVGWLELKNDCAESIEACELTAKELTEDFGRLDVVMRLGVQDAEDAEWVFQILNS